MPFRWISHDIIEEYDAVRRINVTELESHVELIKKLAEVKSPNEEQYGTHVD